MVSGVYVYLGVQLENLPLRALVARILRGVLPHKHQQGQNHLRARSSHTYLHPRLDHPDGVCDGVLNDPGRDSAKHLGQVPMSVSEAGRVRPELLAPGVGEEVRGSGGDDSHQPRCEAAEEAYRKRKKMHDKTREETHTQTQKNKKNRQGEAGRAGERWACVLCRGWAGWGVTRNIALLSPQRQEQKQHEATCPLEDLLLRSTAFHPSPTPTWIFVGEVG